MINRSQHWTDAPHPSLQGRRRRTIRNWANFRTPDVDWAPSNPLASVASASPPNWIGGFDFSFYSLNGPLQIFARDALDVSNRAMLGMRRSDSPDDWLNFKALNVEASDSVVSADGLTITYPGLWPGCDLIYEIAGHKLKEIIKIWDKSVAPAHFEWTVKISPGRTLEITNDIFRLIDDQGTEQIHSRAPWGEDSATTALTPSGAQVIRCTLTEEGTHLGLPVIRLTPNSDDMASAIGEVNLDPTTVISGTTDIDDNTMLFGTPTNNYGAWIRNGSGFTASANLWRSLVKFSTAVIPAETITAFRLEGYRVAHASSTAAGAIDVFRILPANVWVEGTKVGASETGASNWNSRIEPTAWAGAAGCSTSGTDYAADASPPTYAYGAYTSGSDVPVTITLPTSWPTGWRDSTFANNGMLHLEQNAWSSPDFLAIWSSDAVSNALTYEIDYTTAAGHSFFFMGGF